MTRRAFPGSRLEFTMSIAKLTGHLRIIWAIAAKDMVDAVKNRMTLSVIVGIGMMMLTGQAFPFLLRLSNISQVVV